jgi:hypothetical protein
VRQGIFTNRIPPLKKNTMCRFSLAVFVPMILLPSAPAQSLKEETFSYARPTDKGFVPECTIKIQDRKGDWRIVSETHRGDTRMTVSTNYDAKDELIYGTAILMTPQEQAKAVVDRRQGKAAVLRTGKPPELFAVPAGVIVTSAPDWTDIFLLCRRYDRKAGGKQKFAGLWIHPKQPAQLLPFTIERMGADNIEHDGKKMELDRYVIFIRGPSPYVAWADSAGTMVRLVPTPAKGQTLNGLVRAGYEKSAGKLWPPPEK